MQFPNLFQPYRIKKIRFRNRILAAPNGPKYKTYEGFPREFEAAFYEVRAKGGIAQVTTGNTTVTAKYSDQLPGLRLNLEDINGQNYFTEVALAIKRAGAVASVELNHPGALSQPHFSSRKNPIGPMGFVRADGVEVIQMDEALIEEAADDFANAALFAKNCGFDMCMVHGGHGWLIHSFLSPLTNHRTDEYGGSHENRARFAIKVCDRIREKCGNDFLIEFRISADEFMEGGLTSDDCVKFAHLLEDHIDLIHVSSAGLTLANHSDSYRPASYDELKIQYGSSPSPHILNPQGMFVKYAEAVKKSGVKVPVVAVGAIDSPELAESIIAEGKADFVAVARSIIADPEWPNKARRGQRDMITPCIRCEACRGRTGRYSQCTVNPKNGRAMRLLYVDPKPVRKKVAVIGGGVGGMQAALTAVERGHDVTLFEKTDRLGGILACFGDKDYLKREIITYRDSQIYKVNKFVNVVLNKEITRDDLTDGKYDAIICACGSHQRKPPVPGIDKAFVKSAIELGDHSSLGKNVVIIGGGMTGCETAYDLAREGKNVTLVEMLDHLFPETDTLGKKYSMPVFVALKYSDNVRILTSTVCKEIADNGVTVGKADGSEEFIAADSVVYSAGAVSETKLVDEIWDCAPDVIPVGDCVNPRFIGDAVCEGFFAAMNL